MLEMTRQSDAGVYPNPCIFLTPRLRHSYQGGLFNFIFPRAFFPLSFASLATLVCFLVVIGS